MIGDLNKFLVEAKRWKIDVTFCDKLPKDRRKGVYHAPFCDGLACSVVGRQIFIEHEHKTDPLIPSQALHELAHVLIGKKPDDVVDEVDNGMLALEFHTAKLRKFKHWERSMASYQVDGSGGGWKDAGYDVRRKTIAASARESKRIGLLDRNYQPTYKAPCPANPSL